MKNIMFQNNHLVMITNINTYKKTKTTTTKNEQATTQKSRFVFPDKISNVKCFDTSKLS